MLENQGATIGGIFDSNASESRNSFTTKMEVPLSSPGRTLHEVGNMFVFAALLNNGSLFTWGRDSYITRATKVTQKIISVTSCETAFAALLEDGTILNYSTSGIEPLLPAHKKARMIVSNAESFTALLSDESSIDEQGEAAESLFSWKAGTPNGKERGLPMGRKVVSIASTANAFAALLDDGTLFCWGDPQKGGVTPDLHGKTVISLAATDGAFTALLSDRTVLSWGAHSWWYGYYGGKAPGIPAGSSVLSVVANHYAFAAIISSERGNSIISWGDPYSGGTKPPSGLLDENIISIAASTRGFSAMLSSGKIIVWGQGLWSPKKYQLPLGKTAVSISANNDSFSALLNDGTIFDWGDDDGTHQKPHVPRNTKTLSIIPNVFSFAAILDDGTAIGWGDRDLGGYSPSLSPNDTVLSITAINDGFSALIEKNSSMKERRILTWGDTLEGAVAPSPRKSNQVSSLVSIVEKNHFYVPQEFSGIAIVQHSFTPEGVWQYVQAGGDDWRDIPIIEDPSTESAFTLRADAHLRFLFAPGEVAPPILPSLKVRMINFASDIGNGERVDLTHVS